MEGFLDHLEAPSMAVMNKKIWTKRFFKINTAFHVLEFFTDTTQQDRKGKLELNGAIVATADELGELLNDSSIVVEKMRRFTFRITEAGTKKHHYLCADFGANTSSSRQYLEQWTRALRATISAQQEPSLSSATMGMGELNAKISSFMNHMHISARISNRRIENGKSIYVVTVKAWILERELVVNNAQEGDNYGSSGDDMSWQILEYSCAWKLQKSTDDLRNFDDQLRQRDGASLRDVVFPSSSMSSRLNLYSSEKQREADNLHRMQIYDYYLQSLLRLPAFSVFGSDASAILDAFFDISRHLASFRKLERELGQSMHLRDRKVVPWKNRERFEKLYKLHLQVIEAQQERARRLEMANEANHRKELRAERPRRHSHKHRYENLQKINAANVNPLPAPVKVDASAEESRPGESLREHIARIGHRLVTEAFEA